MQISMNVVSTLMAVLTFVPTPLVRIDVAVGRDTDWLPIDIPVMVGILRQSQRITDYANYSRQTRTFFLSLKTKSKSLS